MTYDGYVHTVDSSQLCWITVMYRWGDPANHGYVLGVYSTREGAESAGMREESQRGGKYLHSIQPSITDVDRFDDLHTFNKESEKALWKRKLLRFIRKLLDI